MTRRALFAWFAAAVGAWETSRWKKLAKPEMVTTGWCEEPIKLTEFPETVTKFWSGILGSEEGVTLSEETLHWLGFECAVGRGYFHNGVLSFTEEHPNPLRAANPVPHKTHQP